MAGRAQEKPSPEGRSSAQPALPAISLGCRQEELPWDGAR
jgi:hypothetical protein